MQLRKFSFHETDIRHNFNYAQKHPPKVPKWHIILIKSYRISVKSEKMQAPFEYSKKSFEQKNPSQDFSCEGFPSILFQIHI